ncbi:MAG TPA: hypothetical protein VM940_06160 [Chthoniobacterales bacterium]|jgi:hypothetical protein|nr:hypothetical protein [Chthoniobacterales bacterium]
MKRLLFLLILLGLALAQKAPAAAPTNGEYVLVIGGPSLMVWEKYKKEPHDHWWANFVRAGRLRTEQIRAQDPNAKITWLIYKQGYVDRAAQEKQDLLGFIDSVREKFDLKVIYFSKGNEVINYLNAGQPRDSVKVVNFEYFGHSNAKCFMFDYSSNIESACKSWLHEDELRKINGRVFARGAFAKSWGCHTGESMSRKWLAATGIPMWGVIGKTQYMMDELPVITGKNAKWVTR